MTPGGTLPREDDIRARMDRMYRPQAAIFTVEQYTNGKAKQIDSVSVKKVPSIGDGSPCSGNQPAK